MPTHGAAATSLTPKQKCYIGISGAFGGTLAILADLLQKEQASAVMKVDESLRSTLSISLSPLVVVLLLILFAVALCFVFAVDSNKNAFYRGASILAVLMTFVPYKVPPSIPMTEEQPQPSAAASPLREYFVSEIFAQNPIRKKPTFQISVSLTASDGKKIQSAIYTLLDAATGTIIARSNVQGDQFSFYAQTRDYVLRIEVPNYRIAERRLNVRSSQSLSITISPTWIPLAIQRVWQGPS